MTNQKFCLHCGIAQLREERFPALTIEGSIAAMLELIADYIATAPLEEQLHLFEFTERMMMQNRNDVLRGVYKQDAAVGTMKFNGNG